MFNNLYIRKIFNFPNVYSNFQKFIGKKGIRESFLIDNVGSLENKKILDLGCGTSEILNYIKSEKLYVGIDNNEMYIQHNKSFFANRKTCSFFLGDLNEFVNNSTEKFDVILMFGVMHHINDEAVMNVLTNIKKILAPNGVFVSHDPCLTKKMNPIAKLICKLDRGRFVRYEEEYLSLQKKYWKNIVYKIRKDTLKFLPYSVIYFANKDD